MRTNPLMAIELLRLSEREVARKAEKARVVRSSRRTYARREAVTGEALLSVAAPVPVRFRPRDPAGSTEEMTR